MSDRDPPLLRLLQPDPTRWLALAPTLRAAVLGQLEHYASQRVARDLARLLAAPWWAELDHDDAIRAARVVAHVSASADGAPREPDEPCRRTILDHTLDSLLPPLGRFALCFEDLPLDEDGHVIAGLRLPPATVVLNRHAIAADAAPLGRGPHGWLEARVGTATLVHEVNHLHNLVPPDPTHEAFQDEYRAWYVDFVADAGRRPRRVDALDRCQELLTSPCYAHLRSAAAGGGAHAERILEFLRELGPVAQWHDVLALPRDGLLDPAPLPQPPGNLTNALFIGDVHPARALGHARRMRGFVRIAAAVPTCEVADVDANVEATLALWRRAHDEGHALVAFPELGLTGYTARDLFQDHHLLEAASKGLARLAHAARELSPVAVVGLPLCAGVGTYNVAVALQGGRALAVVPKSYLPNYREFEETRWFRPGVEVPPLAVLDLGAELGRDVPFGTDVLLQADASPPFVVGLELCEDYWVAVPPSALQTLHGATVVVNLSASNFIVGKAELRRLLAQASSDRGKCAYVYVAAGPGESSTDLAFDADAFIVENGRVMAGSTRFSREPQLVSVDVDLERLVRERLVTNTFGDCAREHARSFRRVPFAGRAEVALPLRRTVPRHPFVPQDPATLGARCWEIFEIQTNALATRMRALGRPKLVLGVSGGLDSTHAALVAANALDLRGQPRSDLVCVTMPGLGTTAGTRGNAERLAEALGGQLRVISISEGTRVVLELLGHPAVVEGDDAAALVARLRQRPELGDVTLENVQARLRTLLLMSLANAGGGLVVGTGDLSEKALGWSTYAGDHISMYDVNGGVPKTLMQSVIRWVANERVSTWSVGEPAALRQTLLAILDTPISPELLPADAEGKISQLTEANIGPYELHDFFLYHLVRDGARPARILDLARIAFGGDYALPELQRWLTLFLRRFFTQQFKRSCTADGPKVGAVALSPRGDWRMPSDAQVRGWLAEVASYEP